ncbi:siderophore-interacting protein [Terrimonas sp. NA20]|uniref:Siderophore-interacting protein n=1 Tax=Terrimonas ginsenosidimutans TaxID=2908004 RepID=A0ABS9KP93_9BACT|nr:siderophore-interacting protein [Terrimonas ginsenosidimutans]MCG2614124.1 siderophore-interacting protein [Terrimonas ginsenosidimutans]
MPTLPKWMNDAVEGLLKSQFRQVVATQIEDFSSSVRKVRLLGDFRGVISEPGYAVGFRVNERAFRNYTPFLFDAEQGVCDILFHLHGNGPGSEFAGQLKEGDELRIIIPRGRTVYRKHLSHHVMIGDETALGLALSLRNEASAKQHSSITIFEVDDSSVMAELQLYGHVLQKSGLNKAGRIRQRILQQQEDTGVSLADTGFYLAGNADTMRIARSELKQLNVPSRNIFSQAYWAEGKTGL